MKESKCIPCEAAANTRKREARERERKELIEKLSNLFQHEKIKTVAIVETKNGFLSYREPGDESLSRLVTVEYISFLQGTPIEQVH